ncbi:hypothetical protein L506_4911 [Bordetella bronchiseptica GA96-01]|nr:hypothetical protein L506_4911 [Bordetella bronchiseptica GA96-01]
MLASCAFLIRNNYAEIIFAIYMKTWEQHNARQNLMSVEPKDAWRCNCENNFRNVH